MRRIFGIGETVLDIIFKNGEPQTAKPGGSVLNCLVSLGRLGLAVSFISEYGRDEVGEIIDTFLRKNGVDTSYVYRYEKANSSLALAFLDEHNDAHYSFYKDFPEKRLDIKFPEISEGDIVQCGSFFAVWDEIRPLFRKFIAGAASAGGLVIYDPNFRKSHVSEIDKLKPLIVENMSMAGIVRGSDEDFRNIFGAETADEAWKVVREFCPCLIYTASSAGVSVRTEQFSKTYPVSEIRPVRTIGAGDNFNAGIIASIYKYGISGSQLRTSGEEAWGKIITTGILFATDVCMSYDNYITRKFAQKFTSGS